MNELDFQTWWQLHLRVARGEALPEAEAILYRAGTESLDREETEYLQLASLQNLRQLRKQIQLLTQRLGQLTARNEQLSRKIATLEQTYQQLTGLSLLVDTHVSS